MAIEKAKKANKRDDLALVSFKLSQDYFEQLKAYSKTQTDEAGIELSPSQAARRLMLESLKRHQPKKT